MTIAEQTFNIFFLTVTILIIILLTPYPGLSQGNKRLIKTNQKLVILDFENDRQLDDLIWRCGTTYERTREHATSGSYSLKIEMYPTVPWPGFGKKIKTSWYGYNTLSLNIFNPSTKPIHLSYHIDDYKYDPPYNDRANGELTIKSGANTIIVNLADLRKSTSKHLLNLKKIYRFFLFLHHPKEITTLFIDDLTISKFTEK